MMRSESTTTSPLGSGSPEPVACMDWEVRPRIASLLLASGAISSSLSIQFKS